MLPPTKPETSNQLPHPWGRRPPPEGTWGTWDALDLEKATTLGEQSPPATYSENSGLVTARKTRS